MCIRDIKKGWLLILILGSLCACNDRVSSLEFDPISFSFIDRYVLEESQSEYNVIFFVPGKSCFVCSEDIVDYVNDFNSGKFDLTVIGNDPRVGQALNQKSTYLGLDQLELERHGFDMSDSEIYIFIGDDLIYKNVVHVEEFENINSKMRSLNE